LTIIAFDGKTLACDRQITAGDIKYQGTKWKTLADGTVAAWAGGIDAALLLVDWYENGADPEDFPFSVEDEPHCDLIIWDKPNSVKVYCQCHIPTVFDQPMAWGSGATAGLTALKLGTNAKTAVVIASEVCMGCGMGVDVLIFQEKTSKTRTKK